MITIKMGTDEKEKTFHIHKGFLCHHSKYFCNALKPHWGEKDGSMTFPEDDPKVFWALHLWLHTRRLSDLPTDSSLNEMYLYKVWIFADLRVVWRYASASEISYLYANTVENASLRKFVIHDIVYAATSIDADWFKTNIKETDYPKEYLADLIAGLIVRSTDTPSQTQGNWSLVDMCEYHDHRDVYENQE